MLEVRLAPNNRTRRACSRPLMNEAPLTGWAWLSHTQLSPGTRAMYISSWTITSRLSRVRL